MKTIDDTESSELLAQIQQIGADSSKSALQKLSEIQGLLNEQAKQPENPNDSIAATVADLQQSAEYYSAIRKLQTSSGARNSVSAAGKPLDATLETPLQAARQRTTRYPENQIPARSDWQGIFLFGG